ncbi:hypothetical protein FA95DRAFT_768940 [Auriscalpium vulgare]|uniref:Uncharacterized protein n=1 Tax=Auriscalpium vulgare TaxID=40419 RepID=A0ACB8RAV1_9AGAM|nr:hypothetical protein FA95DRAFT_768940 [Auriscalpium vulgare]
MFPATLRAPSVTISYEPYISRTFVYSTVHLHDTVLLSECIRTLLVARSDSLHNSFGRVLHGKYERNWCHGCGPDNAEFEHSRAKDEDLPQPLRAKTGRSLRTRYARETVRTLVEMFPLPIAGGSDFLTR